MTNLSLDARVCHLIILNKFIELNKYFLEIHDMAKRSKTSAVFPAVATKLVPDLNSRSNQNEFMKELGKTMDFNQEILQSSGLFFRPSVGNEGD